MNEEREEIGNFCNEGKESRDFSRDIRTTVLRIVRFDFANAHLLRILKVSCRLCFRYRNEENAELRQLPTSGRRLRLIRIKDACGPSVLQEVGRSPFYLE